MIAIDTSKDQIDTIDQLESVLKFMRAFAREYDFDRTRFSIIQKNGRDLTTLLALINGRSLGALETILSPKSFKIGKPSGIQNDQSLMQTILNTFSSSKAGVKTAILFTKDNKIKQFKKNFQAADIDMVTVIIGGDDKEKDNDINSVSIDDVKKLPNVYGTLESVFRERLGIDYI